MATLKSFTLKAEPAGHHRGFVRTSFSIGVKSEARSTTVEASTVEELEAARKAWAATLGLAPRDYHEDEPNNGWSVSIKPDAGRWPAGFRSVFVNPMNNGTSKFYDATKPAAEVTGS